MNYRLRGGGDEGVHVKYVDKPPPIPTASANPPQPRRASRTLEKKKKHSEDHGHKNGHYNKRGTSTGFRQSDEPLSSVPTWG
jgi:hypothetical protein